MKTLNRRELSLAISAYFEPTPWIDRCFIEGAHVYSSKRFWELNHEAVRADRVLYVTVAGWQPLDFFHSEDASAKLLEAMPQAELAKVLTNDESQSGSFNWLCFHDCDATGVPVKSPDRKTAIALAFCKFAQLEVEL